MTRAAAAGSPRAWIEAECRRRGRSAVVAGCAALLRGEDVDPGLLVALGGDSARAELARGIPDFQRYWLRVWGARGLLWAWPGEAEGPPPTAELLAATQDPAWRVREMAAKVVARHEIADAWDAVSALRDDPVPRVRAAAERALARLVAGSA